MTLNKKEKIAIFLCFIYLIIGLCFLGLILKNGQIKYLWWFFYERK